MIKNGKIILILMILPFSVFAQTLQTSSPETVKIRDEKQTKQADNGNQNNSAQRRQTYSARPVLSFAKQKRNKEQQKQLLPETEDLSRFAALLQQPKTGIIRLMDDAGCEPSRYVIRADEECLKSIPGGSFYSFRERDYSSSALADIRLKDGLLITDGVFSQNMLVKLGDVPLENVSVNTEGMNFLTEFQPETNTRDASVQYVKLTRGIKVGKYEYIKVFPAMADTTYAMRLVAYRAKTARLYRGFIYDPLAGDERSDVVLAFRVIRKDNGGITLVWKELERKKAPKIENSKLKKS